MRRKKQDGRNERGHHRNGDRNDMPDPELLEEKIFAEILRKMPEEDADDDPAVPLNQKAPFKTGKKEMTLTSRDAIFTIDEPEPFPGSTRQFLATQVGDHTVGTGFCKHLTEELSEYYDALLFGLIDDIYLHHVVIFSASKGFITATIKILWIPEKSYFRLVIPNASDIIENPELVYLVIGDLVEDLVNWLEKPPRRKRSGEKQRKR